MSKPKAVKGKKKVNFNAAANCGAVRTLTTVVVAASTTAKAATATAAACGNNNKNKNTGGVANTSKMSTIAGLDFGTCVPTMKFVSGLGGRPATEFTF